MMDRRAFVTGLAAVAVAGVTPASARALPDISKPPTPLTPTWLAWRQTVDAAFARSGQSFQWEPGPRDPHIAGIYAHVLSRFWHVDIRGDDDATYLLSQRDYVYAVYAERPTIVWLLHPTIPTNFPDLNDDLLDFIGYTVGYVRTHSHASA